MTDIQSAPALRAAARGQRAATLSPHPRHHGGYETAALRNFDPANVAEGSLAAVVQAQSITLSARAITPGGMARPSDAAVFRFRASSKTTGCSTGSSAGSAPLKILP